MCFLFLPLFSEDDQKDNFQERPSQFSQKETNEPQEAKPTSSYLEKVATLAAAAASTAFPRLRPLAPLGVLHREVDMRRRTSPAKANILHLASILFGLLVLLVRGDAAASPPPPPAGEEVCGADPDPDPDPGPGP